MKNVVIGTAGHVDHGKTLLVKALTGIDTDRLKEEKKRGITIELGFAYLPLPNGEKAGIIDVPGHEKFIRNMLAGAGGIDLALLIVAADDGVMPQTREHLEILSLLGIKDGVIAVTKTDLVEPEWVDMVIGEIRQEVKGTFLEDAPIQPVSVVEGKGINELKSLIIEKIGKVPAKSGKAEFRLPVDRVFSVDGFGTVITGTLIEGTLNEGDEVEVYPSGLRTKARNLQVHSKDVETAFAGQRVAVNLARLKKDELMRGDVLALPGSMKNSMMLDVKLNVLKDSKRVIGNGTMVHFYHGASEKLCKLVLLEHDRLQPGEEGYAQLRFSEELAVKRGDRFVVRFYSPVETVGGGIVLDPDPVKHRRKVRRILDGLHVLESGTSGENILQIISAGSFGFVPLSEVRRRLLFDKSTFKNELDKLTKAGKVWVISDKTAIDSVSMEKLAKSAEKLLRDYHKENPLQAGMRIDEFRSRLLPGCDATIADALIDILEKNGVLVSENQKVRLKSFKPKTDGGINQLSEKIEAAFKDAGCAPPTPEELNEAFPKQKDSIKKVLEAMLAEGKLVKVAPQMYFHRGAVDDAVSSVTGFITENGQITLAEFRTASNTSRKFALALLEYFDRHGLTKKVGDTRVLARK